MRASYKRSSLVCNNLELFFALIGATGSPDVLFRVHWVGLERVMKKDGYSYDLRLLPHDFTHAESSRENATV